MRFIGLSSSAPRFVILIAVFVMCACPRLEKPASGPPMALLRPAEYPLFQDDHDFKGLDAGMESSLAYLRRLPPQQEMTFGPHRYRVGRLIHSLQRFRALVAAKPSPERLNALIRSSCRVYRAAGRDGAGTVLFTGYYEPLLIGDLVPSQGCPIPVHSRPADLVEIDLAPFYPDLSGRRITGRYTGRTVVPYSDRGQIRERENFNTIAPPIAWLRDEVDLFILQIQGSGRIELPDGATISVRYDGSNGRPYRSVGRLLLDQGRIEPDAMSMQAIRAYLKQHPQQAETVMNHNPRYIFFKKAAGGPYGALDQVLTPMRSIAVDRSLFPSGALAYIQTPVPKIGPDGQVTQWDTFDGFVLAHDAGNAIKGPGRVDLFWGHGPDAEKSAGRLRHNGRLYFIVLKPEADI